MTNPPFSLFREFLVWILEGGDLATKNTKKHKEGGGLCDLCDLCGQKPKQFLIIGNMNAIKYKETFPLIKANKMWLGASIHSGDREFGVPKEYPLEAAGWRVDENGNHFIRVKGVRWFTNLEHGRRHESLQLMTERESMRFEIKEIQKRMGITVVYVTHDQTEAMAMSDRIILINGGVVQQCGSPEEIYNNPANQFVADFLGKVDFFKGEARDGCICFPAMNGQSIPYDGQRRGRVDVAVRPENLYFSADGPLEGVLETQYYLGDTDDCRVRVGDTLVRVIVGGYEYKRLTTGQPVRLALRDFMVFEDDGTLEKLLEIRT